jgi:hypothetical protein
MKPPKSVGAKVRFNRATLHYARAFAEVIPAGPVQRIDF